MIHEKMKPLSQGQRRLTIAHIYLRVYCRNTRKPNKLAGKNFREPSSLATVEWVSTLFGAVFLMVVNLPDYQRQAFGKGSVKSFRLLYIDYFSLQNNSDDKDLQNTSYKEIARDEYRNSIYLLYSGHKITLILWRNSKASRTRPI